MFAKFLVKLGKSGRLVLTQLLIVAFLDPTISSAQSSISHIAENDESLSLACPGREIDNVATIYFPAPIPPEPGEYKIMHKVRLSNAGLISFDGVTTNLDNLAFLIKSAARNPDAEIGIQSSDDTPLRFVADVIRMLNKLQICNLTLFGNEKHSTAFSLIDARASGMVETPFPAFAKYSDARITLGFGPAMTPSLGRRHRRIAPTVTCRALFNGRPVDGNGIAEGSYRLLDAAVKRAGGPEGIKAEFAARGVEATPRGIIQAPASLPWRCAAGAIFNVQISGYPIAELVLMPD